MKSVLLLDDDKDLCILMCSIFEELGLRGVCIHSYNELQQIDLQKENFDLIFLDINLGAGTKNGIDAYEWVKSQKYDKKIVFFTGHARNYPLLQAKLSEPNVSILEKPAELETIEEILKAI